MISFLGYAAVFTLVVIGLYLLWSMKYILIGLTILGTLGFFITNFVLRNADMSDKNVIKTTIAVVNRTDRILDRVNNFRISPRQLEDTGVAKPEIEPEGFVVPK